ncbi:Hypothetical protein FKW44_021679 [Caligus rogercresseyi]|uniref:Uncharacterized protein n=1 Tax=Caligus rogercresseyi TaxID=217165 RepID=A0A7T8GRP9_CALRO|nr:Hypothetical protein FKW44_021679 [Caligus rogercresseyi]
MLRGNWLSDVTLPINNCTLDLHIDQDSIVESPYLGTYPLFVNCLCYTSSIKGLMLCFEYLADSGECSSIVIIKKSDLTARLGLLGMNQMVFSQSAASAWKSPPQIREHFATRLYGITLLRRGDLISTGDLEEFRKGC